MKSSQINFSPIVGNTQTIGKSQQIIEELAQAGTTIYGQTEVLRYPTLDTCNFGMVIPMQKIQYQKREHRDIYIFSL